LWVVPDQATTGNTCREPFTGEPGVGEAGEGAADQPAQRRLLVTPSGNVPELIASTLVIYGAAPDNPRDLTSNDILFRGTGRISSPVATRTLPPV
jgi:hypothetical protein